MFLSSGGTPAPTTRRHRTASQLNRDVVDARVWSGIHFRFADTAGNRVGLLVADWALDHYFQSRN